MISKWRDLFEFRFLVPFAVLCAAICTAPSLAIHNSAVVDDASGTNGASQVKIAGAINQHGSIIRQDRSHQAGERQEHSAQEGHANEIKIVAISSQLDGDLSSGGPSLVETKDHTDLLSEEVKTSSSKEYMASEEDYDLEMEASMAEKDKRFMALSWASTFAGKRRRRKRMLYVAPPRRRRAPPPPPPPPTPAPTPPPMIRQAHGCYPLEERWPKFSNNPLCYKACRYLASGYSNRIAKDTCAKDGCSRKNEELVGGICYGKCSDLSTKGVYGERLGPTICGKVRPGVSTAACIRDPTCSDNNPKYNKNGAGGAAYALPQKRSNAYRLNQHGHGAGPPGFAGQVKAGTR